MVERAATVEYKTIISSSPRWNELPHRSGDVVVCTPPKVGTTWTQGIVRSLIAGREEPAGSIPIDAPNEAMASARLADDVRGWYEHGSLATGRRREER